MNLSMRPRRGRLLIRPESLWPYCVLTIAGATALGPVLWGLLTAFKAEADVLSSPPRWLPSTPTFENFASVLLRSRMPRYFLNSTIVGSITGILSLSIAVLAAYGVVFARIPGRRLILLGLLTASMMPGIAILVPLYTAFVRLNLVNTYLGVILVYSAWQVPTLIWIARSYLSAVPAELVEAARLDGCTEGGLLRFIIIPLSGPMLVATFLLAFVYVWNDFLIAITLITREQMRLATVGLYMYVSQYGIQWGELMAAVSLAIAPPIAIFLSLQRLFVQGLMGGAIKG